MQEQYQVAFDLSTQPFEVEPGLVILPIIGLILVVTPQALVDRFTRGPSGRAGKIFAWFFFLFSSAISAVWLFGSLAQTANLESAIKAGEAYVVEGCLQHFHPMPEGGHDSERLQLDGRVFEYSDYLVTAAFNNAESHGGPIHPDSRLRLTVVGSDIVKVEVQQHACPAAPDFPKG